MEGGIRPHAIDIRPATSTTTTLVSPQPTDRKPTFRDHMTSLNSDEIGALLQSCRERQDGQDPAYDMEDLRHVMQAALRSSSDAEIIDLLQVDRHEIPEAVRALQRALEKEVDREQDAGSSHGEERYVDSARTQVSRVALDREFLEAGIDAFRRMSGTALLLPPWAITKWEVDREEKIGIGFFSDVYKGSWGGVWPSRSRCSLRQLHGNSSSTRWGFGRLFRIRTFSSSSGPRQLRESLLGSL